MRTQRIDGAMSWAITISLDIQGSEFQSELKAAVPHVSEKVLQGEVAIHTEQDHISTYIYIYTCKYPSIYLSIYLSLLYTVPSHYFSMGPRNTRHSFARVMNTTEVLQVALRTHKRIL